jgi:hypothetical protein
VTARTEPRPAAGSAADGPDPDDRQAPAAALTRLLDGALSWAVGALAWWTLLFHVAMPLRWHRDLVGGAWVAGLLVSAVVLARWPDCTVPRRWAPVRPQGRWVAAALVAAAVAASALSATRWPDERPQWWVFWAAVVAITACAVAVAARAIPIPARAAGAPGPERSIGRAPGPTAVLAVVVLALLAAAGSAFTVRPDADDVFLVNRSTYVAEHPGPLPQRDTLFSDEVFAVTRPDAVPTSFEALVGVVAAWSPVSAPTVTYLLVGPLAALLAVLALWRMLRTLGAVAPALATAAACAFLLLDGGVHYSHGNFHFARAWQGKVVFLIVVVPALWHHGLRWARDGRHRDLALLLAANLAGIGLTTTAAFVAPAVTGVVVVAGAWASGAWQRLLPGLAATLPPLLGVIAFTALPRQDISVGDRLAEAMGPVLAWIPPWFTLTGGINPGRQWHWILDGGIGLLIPAAAALAAWAFVTDRAARMALALAPLLLFGLLYGPGTFDAIADVSGVRAILWRSGWILPVPAAVGLACTAPLLLARSAHRTALGVLVPVVVLGAMAIGSTWVLDEDNMGMRVGELAWDIDPHDRAAAERLIDLTEPGDVILAPETIGGAIAIQTTRVRAVNPRGTYMSGRHAVPEFRGDQRRMASSAMVLGLPPDGPDALAQAIQDVDASTACVSAALEEPDVERLLSSLGFAPAGEDPRCRFWRR